MPKDEKYTGKRTVHECRPATRARRDIARARQLVEEAGRAILANQLEEARRLMDEAEKLMDRRI